MSEQQECRYCKQILTPRQINRGARQMREVILIIEHDVHRGLLCVECEVAIRAMLYPKKN